MIGIFGSSGMLGKYVSTILGYKAILFTRADYNILTQDKNRLEQLIIDNKLKIIVNCAGLIKQKCPPDSDLHIVNANFPIILSDICEKYNIKLIHISTDCVYNGKKGKYIETDLHDCTDLYGKTKSNGENIKATIIRTSIIGHETGTKYSFLEWALSATEPVNGYINHYWNGVTCLELAKIIKNVIDNNLWWEGVRHMFSPDIVSKFDLVKLVRSIYCIEGDIHPTSTELVDRSLMSAYPKMFDIPPLIEQIKTQKDFKIDG